MALSKIKKNKLWIWKAYRRETGELIDWECGGRDKGTLLKLMERLSKWNVELFCTDNWRVYQETVTAAQGNLKARLRLEKAYFKQKDYIKAGKAFLQIF